MPTDIDSPQPHSERALLMHLRCSHYVLCQEAKRKASNGGQNPVKMLQRSAAGNKTHLKLRH